MSSATPMMNFLRAKGKKVIVECGGRVFSVPLEDVQNLSLSDYPTQKPHYTVEEATRDEHIKPKGTSDEGFRFGADEERAASDSFSESSISGSECLCTKDCAPEPVASSSASQVLSKLKDEVMRLIDESILKIEQDWAEKSVMVKADPQKAEVLAVAENITGIADDIGRSLHPDGDRNHREQNLQVLHTKLFVESKRLARMKLLDEIHALVDRLKDMETLE